jgi:RHS repeat-associated protein
LCGCTEGGPPVSASVLDPVDTATGDFHESTSDLSVPGPGVPLVFTRTYDAEEAQAEAGSSVPSPLGDGWTDNLGMSLTYNASTKVATVTEENGAQITFSPSSGSSNGWCADATTNFCANAPRIEATLVHDCTPVPTCTGTWTFSRDTGVSMTFTFASGATNEPLTEIQDAAGNTLTPSSYTGSSCPSGDTCTAWTSSASGGQLVLAVNSSNQLVEVFDPASDREATFTYSGTGCPSGSETPELCSVDDPGSIPGTPLVTIFTYDTTNTSTTGCPSSTECYQDDMLTVTGPTSGATTTNCYSGDSCASGLGGSPGQIVSQENPDGVTSVLCYSGTNSSIVGGTTTVAIDPSGSGCTDAVEQTAYQYSSDVLVAQTDGTGTSSDTEYFDRDWTSLIDLETVDGNGDAETNTLQTYDGPGGTPTSSANITSTIDAMGNTTETAYNAANQPYCTVDAADLVNGSTCPAMTTVTSGASLPQSTIDVGSTTGFSTSLPLAVPTTAGIQAVTCTGTSSGPPAFTGCSGGSGTMSGGVTILQAGTAPTRGSDPWPGAAVTIYDGSGNSIFTVTALGDVSQTDYTAPTDGVGPGELPYCTIDAVEYNAGITCPSTPPTSPPTGEVKDYTTTIYNSAGFVTSSTNPNGGTTSYTYESSNPTLVATETDPDGDVTTNTYNSVGQLIQKVESFETYSSTSITAYDSAGRVYCTIAALAYSEGDTTCPVVTVLTSAVSLPQSTIDVASTTGFSTSGYLAVPTTTGIESVTCTGSTSTTFTGCTGGSGTMPAGVNILPATTPPAPASDPWPGTTITIDDEVNQPIYSVNPIGGVTQTTYDGAGNVICTASPINYGYVPCPTSPPTPPTTSSDPYLHDTITSYDSLGRPTQVTNPLGGITLTSYDSGNNVEETQVESSSSTSTADPTVTTYNVYNGDNQVTSSTVGYGESHPSTTLTSYDPNGDAYCTVSAKVDSSGTDGSTYQCPPWQPGWIVTPPDPLGSAPLYTTGTPSSAQAKNVTTTFYNEDGQEVQTTDPDIQTSITAVDADGRTYCTSDPSNVDAGSYPYPCPAPGASHVTGTVTTSYDADDNVVSTADQDNDVTGYSYDAAGDKIAMTDPRGYATSYCYYYEDSSGECATGARANGWSKVEVDGTSNLESVSCLDPYFCAEVNNDGRASLFNGSSWSTSDADGTNALNGVSCPTTSFCDAVDGVGNVVQWSSSTWTVLPDRDTYPIRSVSCTGVSVCVAVDNHGRELTDTPSGGWGTASMIDGTNVLTSVSCSSATSCMAVDSNGKAVELTSAGWGSPTTIDSGHVLESVSCATSAFCVAVDNDGQEFTYQLGSWASSGTTIDSGEVLDSVSCPTMTFCMAVDGDGNSVAWNGSGWSPVTDIDTTRPLAAVSCATGTFCVAVDNDGHAVDFEGTGSANDVFSRTIPSPSGGSGDKTTYTYYPGGLANVTGMQSGTTTDTYDAMGDLANIDEANAASGYSAAPSVSYSYYQDGARAEMVDGTGETFYTVDADDDLTEQHVVSMTSTPGSTTEYTYYPTGDLESVTYPSYGSTTNPEVTYTYDYLGHMATESDWLGNEVAFAHDGDGNETAQCNDVTVPSDCTTTTTTGTSATSFSYDDADENTVNNSTLSCGTLTQNFSGGSSVGQRNDDGQVRVNTDDYVSGGTCTAPLPSARYYNYDEDGRVVYQGTETQGSSSDTFAYDADGDPTTISSTQGSSFDTYTDAFNDADEVTSQTPTGSGSSSSYTYDSLRDQTSDASTSTTDYDYDQLGQLTGTTGASTASYTYSGDGLEDSALPTPSGWSAATATGDSNVIVAVSCPTSTWCMALDSSHDYLIWNGAGWSAAATTGDTSHSLEAVSCPTTSFCAAVDNHGGMLTYSSGVWSSPTSIDGTLALDSVSCVSATSTQCVAVDADGNAVNYYDSAWTSTGISSYALNSVSCVTTSFCEAADNYGHVFSFSGGASWSSGGYDVDGTRPLEAISCVSTATCAVTDNHGDAYVGTGTSWQGFTGIDSTHPLTSVACATSTFCIAVDTSGHSVTYDGYDWYAVTTIDSANTPKAVSCPSEAFCALVDSAGDALTYEASNLTWDTNGSLSNVLSDGTNDYIEGPTGEPVEQISTTATEPSVATFMTFTPGDSSWLLTNTAGNEVGFYSYDAFGTLSFSAGVQSLFGYAGQYQGTSANSSGIQDMQARWYDDQTGEFTTLDPAFNQTDQAYAYAEDDPVNEDDPSGLTPTCEWAPDLCNQKHLGSEPSADSFASNSTMSSLGDGAFVISDTADDYLDDVQIVTSKGSHVVNDQVAFQSQDPSDIALPDQGIFIQACPISNVGTCSYGVLDAADGAIAVLGVSKFIHWSAGSESIAFKLYTSLVDVGQYLPQLPDRPDLPPQDDTPGASPPDGDEDPTVDSALLGGSCDGIFTGNNAILTDNLAAPLWGADVTVYVISAGGPGYMYVSNPALA